MKIVPHKVYQGVHRLNRTLLNAAARVMINWSNATLHRYDAIFGNVAVVDWSNLWLKATDDTESVMWNLRELWHSGGAPSLNWEDRTLKNFAGNVVFDWENCTAADALGEVRVNWNSGALMNSSGAQTVSWEAGTLIDSGAVERLDWENRLLYGKWTGVVQPSVPAAITISGGNYATNVDNGDMQIVTVSASGTMTAPTGTFSDGHKQTWRLVYSGAYTVTFDTGAAGKFRYGTDITAGAAGSNGTCDYVSAIYNAASQRWDIVAWVAGY
jgi:hypothetical protein